MARVLTIALASTDQAISLNPSAIDAYRDRAEVLRTIKQLNEAQSVGLDCLSTWQLQAGGKSTHVGAN